MRTTAAATLRKARVGLTAKISRNKRVSAGENVIVDAVWILWRYTMAAIALIKIARAFNEFKVLSKSSIITAARAAVVTRARAITLF